MLLQSISPISEYSTEVYLYSEIIELELSLQCLKMPILEKKFIGHSILASKINHVKTVTQTNHVSNLHQLRQRWLTKSLLINWIDDNHIFQMIFSESTHTEVIKKSHFLLEFLYQNNRIGEKELSLMWECARQKHEVQKVAILKAIQFLAMQMKYKDLVFIFQQIKNTQLQNTDKLLMMILKTIAKNISVYLDGNKKTSKRYDLIMAKDSNKKPQRRSSDVGLKQNKDLCIKSNDDIINDKKTKGRSSSFGDKFGMKLTLEKSVDQNQVENKARQIDSDKTGSFEEFGDITNVPKSKEDKNTADEDGSQQKENIENQIFDEFDQEEQIQSSHHIIQEEESKQEYEDDLISRGEKRKSILYLCSEQRFIVNQNEDQEQIIEIQQYKQLGEEVIQCIWQYTQEDKLFPNQQNQNAMTKQVHQISIENFCYTMNYLFPLISFYYMKKCIQNLKNSTSVISSQKILIKLIEGTAFPISFGNSAQLQDKISLPENRSELIIALDQDLKLTSQCLFSYVEFKRIAIQLIFDRYADNMDNEMIGGLGDQDENLETQSSLDNDANRRNTAEDQSRFSQSIISSTQKSDTEGGSLTQPPAFQNIISNSNKYIKEHDRGQSMPKHSRSIPQAQAHIIVINQNETQNNLFDTEPNSAQFKAYQIEQSKEQIKSNEICQMNSEEQFDENIGSSLENKIPICKKFQSFNIEHKVNKNQEQFQKSIEEHQSIEEHNNQAQLSQSGRQSQINRNFLNQLITNEALNLNFIQEMNSRLDFLKFIMNQTHGQLVQSSQINLLWETLVVNGFSVDERDQFFIFCTEVLTSIQCYQYKVEQQNIQQGNELAGELLFEDDSMEMIFFEIILRLDFKSQQSSNNIFTKQMYLCFEKFFIYINEQYGQLVTKTSSISHLSVQACTKWHNSIPKFDVYDDQLIGIEALWEIILVIFYIFIQEISSHFLMQLYKQLENDSNNKQQFYQTCMTQIQKGLKDINKQNQELLGNDIFESQPIQQIHPDLENSQSIEESKNRIAKSIKLMSKYITEFEGSKNKKQKNNQSQEVNIMVNNQIQNCKPLKFNLKLAQSQKLSDLKEAILTNLDKEHNANEISILFRGKDLTENMKTLKEYQMKSIQPDGSHVPIKIMLTLKNSFELEYQNYQKQEDQYSDEQILECMDNLKLFLGDFGCSEDVIKLALKKCKLNIEETIFIVTEPDQVNDLEEEIKQEQEAIEQQQLLHNQQLQLISGEDKDDEVEIKLSEMISNNTECFNLLFDLLNLGVPEITESSWSLLTQIPINQQLLKKIRLLKTDNKCMNQSDWAKIIDPNNIHKMLYSLQLVNQLITINNEKLCEEEIQERFEWRTKFLEQGGFEHLYYIIITYEFNFQNTNKFQQVEEEKVIESVIQKPKKRLNNLLKNSQNDLFQKTQAQCLDHLIGIIRIFLQAAILTTNKNNLLSIIASTQTSPFKKFQSSCQNQGQEVSDSHSDKEATSSQNTPKFANSFASNPVLDTSQQKINEDIILNIKSQHQMDINSITQVDDFPKLIDQINQNSIATNILNNIVDFQSIIKKILEIIYQSACIFENNDDPVPSLIQNCLDLLLPCLLLNPEQNMVNLYEFPLFKELLTNSLINNQNEKIRKSIDQTFKSLCNYHQNSKLRLFLLEILLENIPQTKLKGWAKQIENQNYDEYFQLLSLIIKISEDNFSIESYDEIKCDDKFSAKNILTICCNTVKTISLYLNNSKKNNDRRQNQAQNLLCGHLLLCQSILEIKPDLKSHCQQLISTITNFILASQIKKNQLNRSTKKRSFNLLLTLIDNNDNNYNETLEVLFQFYSQIEKSWNYVDFKEFNEGDIGFRQQSGYVGLKNFGCTCYMNSLLQNLFMIQNLRNHVLDFTNPDSDPDNNLLYQLQQVFMNLQESQKSYYVPKGFVDNFKFYGEPVNVRVQQDTHEFYNVLCDQIEQLIPKPKDSNQNNFLQTTIGGLLCNETKSLEEEHPYLGEKEEAFYAITLDIKNKKNIQEALDTYIKPDVLDGDNKYHCEKWDKKIAAHRRTYIKELSNTVVINLKRFEFDYNTMQRLKVNDYCEFPETINFKKWTKEGIQEETQPLDQQINDVSAEFSDVSEDEIKSEENQAIIDQEVTSFDAKSLDSKIETLEESKNELIEGVATSEQQHNNTIIDMYEYQLVGVLVHSGSADGGHYYSYIKERNNQSPNYGKWFEFNDSTVKEFCFDNLKKECFGGQQQNENDFDIDQMQNKNIYERCSNAYLIFYERILKIEEAQINTINSESRLQLYKPIHEQNKAFQNLKIYSENDFIHFMIEFIKLSKSKEVLYFAQTSSETLRIKNLKQLTYEYTQDWETQQSKAKRQAEIQKLRGEEVSPIDIQLTRDYYQEQIDITFSKKLKSIFEDDYSSQDGGLKIIKLGTILAIDIIMKLNQKEQFVQLMQRLNIMFQSNAEACVWFVKWICEQTNVLQQILLCSIYPEVREVFATLIATTFGVTIRNEEPYLADQQQVADFECESKYINSFQVKEMQIPKSASIRLVKMFLDELMSCAKVNWKNFNEYFLLLKDFAQSHFQIAAYFIQNSFIMIILEFVMNNKAPFFQNNSQFKMGDMIEQPNFQHAWELLSYLIKCCLTSGITYVSHYSPQSVFQQDLKHLNLPEQQIFGLLTSECFNGEILQNSHLCSDLQNQAVEQIVVHLSWGNLKQSEFFIVEIMKHLKFNKSNVDQINYNLELIRSLLKLEDDVNIKTHRIMMFLNVQTDLSAPNAGYQSFSSLFSFFGRIREQFPIYLLKLLNFIGDMANNDPLILQIVQQSKNDYIKWVWAFLVNIDQDQSLITRANQKFNMNLINIQQAAKNNFRKILELTEEDGDPQYVEEELKEAIVVQQYLPQNEQSQPQIEDPTDNKENIKNLLFDQNQDLNDSFSGIESLKKQDYKSSDQKINFYENKNDQSFNMQYDEEAIPVVENKINPTYDEDDEELHQTLNNINDKETVKNPFHEEQKKQPENKHQNPIDDQDYGNIIFNDETFNQIGVIDDLDLMKVVEAENVIDQGYQPFENLESGQNLFDNDDPQFLKRQQEQYEKYQQMYMKKND